MSDYGTIKIARNLYDKMKEDADEKGYRSVAEYVSFYMRLVLRGDIE